MLVEPVPGARPEDCLTASLHHLELFSPDPGALSDFYHRALGYRLEPAAEGVAGCANGRRLLFKPGPKGTLAGAGYALPDRAELDRLRDRIAAAGRTFESGPTHFFSEAVSIRDPDGTRFTFGLARNDPAAPDKVGALAARLQHVVVASRQPERMVEFFTEVLGFTVSDHVVDGAGEVRTSFLRCSHEHHSFAVFKADEDRLDHHCYETSDWNQIRDWCDHMAEQRIPLTWGPGRHGPGNNLFFFVHDVDGNWVEVSAELEVVRHDRPVGHWPHEERTLNSWGAGLLRS